MTADRADLPDWVVQRVAAQIKTWPVTTTSAYEADLRRQAAAKARVALAEFLRILEERGLRIVPKELTAAMHDAIRKPVPELRRAVGEEPGQENWITNREKRRLRWRLQLEAAPPLAELLAGPRT